jgi:hypothetical protein
MDINLSMTIIFSIGIICLTIIICKLMKKDK